MEPTKLFWTSKTIQVVRTGVFVLRFLTSSSFIWTAGALVCLPEMVDGATGEQEQNEEVCSDEELTVLLALVWCGLVPRLYEALKFHSEKQWTAEPGFHSTAMETALCESVPSGPCATEASLSLELFLNTHLHITFPPLFQMIKEYSTLEKWGVYLVLSWILICRSVFRRQEKN